MKTPGQDELTPVKTPLRTPVKPLRATAQLEETIFNELMDADHGPHWTSPAKSDEELFVEIAEERLERRVRRRGASAGLRGGAAAAGAATIGGAAASIYAAAPRGGPRALRRFIQGFARGRAATPASRDDNAGGASTRACRCGRSCGIACTKGTP